jgi:Fungal chitosanase of glycosyl hydrolase group 75
MRKQIVHSILSAFLCASGFAQRVEGFGEAPFSHLQSSHSAGWRSILIGNFEDIRKNAAEPGMLEGRPNSCANTRSMLLDIVERDRHDHNEQRFHQVTVRQLPDGRAFYFVTGMTIDADGAPNAYNPDDTGLDELANAGEPARWNGIITDRNGDPLIQQQSDPFPGYYISCTSLSDRTRKFEDPTRYVDASKIPYLALPQDVADWGGARLGDFAVVMNLRNGKSTFAIYADVGTVGEGSVALADALGIRSDARYGGESEGILYLWFPGSGNLQPRTIAEIQEEGEKLLLHYWGGREKSFSCAENGGPAIGGAEF